MRRPRIKVLERGGHSARVAMNSLEHLNDKSSFEIEVGAMPDARDDVLDAPLTDDVPIGLPRGKVAARLAYPTDDHELRQLCAQMRPTSVPNMDVPHSRRVNGKSP